LNGKTAQVSYYSAKATFNRRLPLDGQIRRKIAGHQVVHDQRLPERFVTLTSGKYFKALDATVNYRIRGCGAIWACFFAFRWSR
jgi:hypothetical protein